MRPTLVMGGITHAHSHSHPDPAGSFEALLVQHQQRIYFFIRSMVFDPDDARDVLQDVNAIIIRKRGQFVTGTDFKSWAFAIARFECLGYLSRLKKGSPAALESDVVQMIAESAEERADDTEAWLTALAQCRQSLPAEAAELLDLRYQQRVMLEVIADRWNTSVGALKQKLFRIRAQLRACVLKRLGKPGMTPGEQESL